VCIETGAVNTVEGGGVGVSLLIISLKTEMLEYFSFCCDGKKQEERRETRRRKGRRVNGEGKLEREFEIKTGTF
jgi:hypothetical protein